MSFTSVRLSTLLLATVQHGSLTKTSLPSNVQHIANILTSNNIALLTNLLTYTFLKKSSSFALSS